MESSRTPKLDRRTVLGAGTALIAAGATAGAARAAEAVQGAAAQAAPAPAAPPAASRVPAGLAGSASSDIFAVVETNSGKVQGIINAGVHAFKGIPYGAPTGGKNRWMPPEKPLAWKGVRNAIGLQPICPQTQADLRAEYAMMIQWDCHVGPGGMDEDVLHLNVWTPGVNDGGKRPVLVSFHGGGYTTGSGNFPGYDGAQLARFGNVVVVTVTHRLAAYGYLNLVDAGAPAEFAHAGVCGIMDLVASLEWVRDNIERFGGDPKRVMIFGQSGGGAKTSVMLGNPAAKGLFHRAAVQSGSALKLATREDSAKMASALLKKLGISPKNAKALQSAPWQDILTAQTGVAPTIGGQFGPVLDGTYFPHHPFEPVAPQESADVPVIISTMMEDAALRLNNFDLDEAGLSKIVAARYGADKAGEIVSMYRKAWPNKTPYLIQAQIFTDSGFRRSAYAQGERKSALGKAPAYMYLWEWPSPGFGGKFGAVHGIDVSASFYNVRDPIVGVGNPEGVAMCKRHASSWVAFASTGDPNNPEVPHWTPYDATNRATMIFDTNMRMENDPRGEMRNFWTSMPPASGPAG
jgi:para-nitrobenzyl esterase